MTAVQQQVLNWLYSVLTSEYTDVNRTYNDVAQTLSQYSSLSPRTDVYTYENGASALLLHISGILPVNFRGTTYRFPIAIWVPHAYPREAPVLYVIPTEERMVRPRQHVDPQGKVYHPYLAGWAGFWDKSNILDLLAILREIFAKESPVISRQQNAPSLQQPTPPPRPPLPRDIVRSSPHAATPNANDQARPPPPPPKPTTEHSYTPAGPSRRDSGPPLPPLPPQVGYNGNKYGPQIPRPFQDGPALPQRKSSLRYEQPPPLPPQPQRQQTLRASPSPVSPITPPEDPYRRSNMPPNALPQQGQPITSNPTQQAYPPNNFQQVPPPYLQQQSQQYPGQHPPQWQQFQQQILGNQPQSQPQPTPAPPPDLLSGPLTITLPSNEPPIAPPVPPNPEKHALLRTIAQALYQQRQRTVSQSTSTIPPLQSQRQSLLNSLSALNTEIHSLESINSLLDSNTAILHTALQNADSLIADSKNWKEPGIDELLVAPTVVGNQLYSLLCEERALADAIFFLGRAVEKGRVETSTFIKVTRGLSREWFLKKALVSKIAKGMGLAT